MEEILEELLEELKQKANQIKNPYDRCSLIDLLETEIRQGRPWRFNKQKVRWMVRCLEG